MNKMTVLDFVLKIENPETVIKLYDVETLTVLFDGRVGNLILQPDRELCEVVNIGALKSDFYIGVRRIEEQK